MLVGATMNPHGTGGTHLLNRDLDSRFSVLERGYPDSDDMKKILKVSGIPTTIGDNKDVRRKLATFFEMIASNYDTGQVDNVLSPREIVGMGKIWMSYEELYDGHRSPFEKMIELKVRSVFGDDEFDSIVREWISNTFNIPYR